MSVACCSSSPRWYHRAAEVAGWALPSASLVLLPKCPACLAAYIALISGLGISISLASYLRSTLLMASIAALIYLTVKNAQRLIRIKKHHQENK